MRRISLLLLLLCVAACGGGLRDKVLGTWHVDVSTIEGGRLTPFLKQQPAIAGATLELKKDGTFVSSGGGATTSGRWSMTENRITLQPGTPEDAPMLVSELDGSKLHLTFSEGGDQVKLDYVRG